MKVFIKAKTKKQKQKIHKCIIDSIKHTFGLFAVSNMQYWEDKNKGTDYSGCSIQIIDIFSETDYKNELNK